MMRSKNAMAAIVFILVLAVFTAMVLSGCGGNSERSSTPAQQGVSEVMQKQMQSSKQSSSRKKAFVGDSAPAFAQVDFDLTAMGADMVYGTVYDMMTNPARYEGKIVKMNGPYYHVFYEPTNKDYFSVIIQDATACCSQGLEFVWGNGSHVYPDEYPADGEEVVVTGRFKTYTEGSTSYIHLVDASLQAA